MTAAVRPKLEADAAKEVVHEQRAAFMHRKSKTCHSAIHPSLSHKRIAGNGPSGGRPLSEAREQIADVRLTTQLSPFMVLVALPASGY